MVRERESCSDRGDGTASRMLEERGVEDVE